MCPHKYKQHNVCMISHLSIELFPAKHTGEDAWPKGRETKVVLNNIHNFIIFLFCIDFCDISEQHASCCPLLRCCCLLAIWLSAHCLGWRTGCMSAPLSAKIHRLHLQLHLPAFNIPGQHVNLLPNISLM